MVKSGWMDGRPSERTYTKNTNGAKNGIRDACSTMDIINCLLVCLYLFFISFYLDGLDWISEGSSSMSTALQR